MPYPVVAVAFVALLKRDPDRFEQPFVAARPLEAFDVVVERAARDAHAAHQVPQAKDEPFNQQHQTGLLAVGQVVRVCALVFSHQLPAVTHHLQLDCQLVPLGAPCGPVPRPAPRAPA